MSSIIQFLVLNGRNYLFTAAAEYQFHLELLLSSGLYFLPVRSFCVIAWCRKLLELFSEFKKRWQGAGGGPWEPRRAPVHAGKGRTGRAAADAGRVGGQERGTGVKRAQGERGGSDDKM
ncbi:hypothetical protein MHYP_G00223450 [Metynnis hypsauchen]